MTDLRTLLHESAPTPTRPLDMRAVRRRAQHTRARRALAWLAAIGVLVGIGVPTGGALLSPADRSGVDAIGGDRATTTTSVADELDAPDGDSSEVASDASHGAAVGDPASPAPVTLPVPIHGLPASTTTTTRPDAADYPRAASCSVDDAGLEQGQQRICRFTATEPGSAHMRSDGFTSAPTRPEGQVTVTRDGVSTTYGVTTTEVTAEDPNGEELRVFAGGGAGSIIEPGDLVEVVLTRTSSTPPTATTVLTAGD